ncbi:MAG: MerR family transcriptional regulator [Actinomycetota bacterium]|nr:MerR family transcriptional regulator [Actinomycetota bacterium]
MEETYDKDVVGAIRIGELSRRVGVSAELLRAWERRYDLLSPARTSGGFRLYGPDDERRVLRMREHLAAGMSAAEAAGMACREPLTTASAAGTNAEQSTPDSVATGELLRQALDRFDEPAAHAVLDRLLSGFSLQTVVHEAVMPYLHELGDRWEAMGDAVIAEEHFASALLRGRLLGLARGWGAGYGPLGLLACLPGDPHDLGLICFGLALRATGWRIVFLGPDTPLATVAETAARLRPALVVLTAMIRPPPDVLGRDLSAITASAPLALGGRGVFEADAAAVGARYLSGDPFVIAAALAAEVSGR